MHQRQERPLSSGQVHRTFLQVALTIFDHMLVTEHEDDVPVLNAEPVVQDFEVLAERLLVVTSTQRDLKYLSRA